MKKIRIKLGIMAFLAFVFLPEIAKSEGCGQLVFGRYLKINREKICVANDAGRECAVVIDPCPVQ